MNLSGIRKIEASIFQEVFGHNADRTCSNSDILLIDCRPFIAFNSGHIRGAHNINCPPIVKRRSGGSLPIANVITCPTTREKFLKRQFDQVVVYDQNTGNIDDAAQEADIWLVVKSLLIDTGLEGSLFYVEGGYDAYSALYPHLCVEHRSPTASGSSSGNCKPCSPKIRHKETQECNQGKPIEILPWLFIGNSFHASQCQTLRDLNITALLNVSNTCENYFQDSFTYLTIPVEDNSSSDIGKWFQKAIAFIESVRYSSGKILVHCHAGISRSATVCIAYIMYLKKLSLEDAYSFVKSKRSVIAPNLNFMRQLLDFEAQLEKEGLNLKPDVQVPKAVISPLSFSTTARSTTSPITCSPLSCSCTLTCSSRNFPTPRGSNVFDFSFENIGSHCESPVLTPHGYSSFFNSPHPLVSPS